MEEDSSNLDKLQPSTQHPVRPQSEFRREVEPLKRRVWRKVPLFDRFKLESAVNFGLPVDFAGKVVGIQSTNTDRIIKDHKSRRK